MAVRSKARITAPDHPITAKPLCSGSTSFPTLRKRGVSVCEHYPSFQALTRPQWRHALQLSRLIACQQPLQKRVFRDELFWAVELSCGLKEKVRDLRQPDFWLRSLAKS